MTDHPYFDKTNFGRIPDLRKFAAGLKGFDEAYERALVAKVSAEMAAADLASQVEDDDTIASWLSDTRVVMAAGEGTEPPSRMIIDGLGPVLPLGKLCLLTGSRDAGKTWVAAVTAAQEIHAYYERFSYDPVVLWFDYERQPAEFREKLDSMGARVLPARCATKSEAEAAALESVRETAARYTLTDERKIEHYESLVGEFQQPENEAAFEYLAPYSKIPADSVADERAGAGLAVFDAYRGLEHTEMGSSGDTSGANAESVYRRVIQPFMERDTACVVTAHLTGDGKKTLGAERLESMSDIVLRVEKVVPFSKNDSGYSKIKVIRDRCGNFSDGQTLGYLVMELGHAPRLTATEPEMAPRGPEGNGERPKAKAASQRYQEVDAAILACARTPRKTQRDISNPVGAALDMDPETVRRRVRVLETDGKIVRNSSNFLVTRE